MELNKRDKKKYNRFLKQIEKSEDKKLQVYSLIISDFIEKNYNSNDSNTYEIDDFIQEAYALLYTDEVPIEEIYSKLNDLYYKMNHNTIKNDASVPIDFKKYLETIENPIEKEVLKAILLDEDLEEQAKELNITRQNLKEILIKLSKDLKQCLKDNEVVFKTNNKNSKTR